MTIFCSFCDAEAVEITTSGSGLCGACALAYELGQSEPEEPVGDVEDPAYRNLYFEKHPDLAGERDGQGGPR